MPRVDVRVKWQSETSRVGVCDKFSTQVALAATFLGIGVVKVSLMYLGLRLSTSATIAVASLNIVRGFTKATVSPSK